MVQEEFVNKILDILSPMPNVTAVKNRDHIVLYKDGVVFGKVIEQRVCLLSNGNKFIEFEEFIVAFLEDDEMMNVNVLKKIYSFILDDENFIKSQIKSKSSVSVSIQRIREQLEMKESKFDFYFNYLSEKD